WQRSVHDGVVALPESETRKQKSAARSLRQGWQKLVEGPARPTEDAGYEVVFQPDPTIYDGRFANNGWLQELPKPMTALTWDNAAIMSPATAKELGVDLGSYAHGGEHGGYHPDVVELQFGDAKVRAPIWIMPGHADHSITVSFGYGRQWAGRVGGTPCEQVGFNAYPLRNSNTPWFGNGLSVRRTGERYELACTQQHHSMENRDLIRTRNFDEYRNDFRGGPERSKDKEHES